MSRADILAKIKKLLRLAENAGATSAEAATAAATAARLKLEYDVAEEEVGDSGEPVESAAAVDYDVKNPRVRIVPWQRVLIVATAKTFGCRVYRKQIEYGKFIYRVIGRPSDVDAARALNFWIVAQINSISRRESAGKTRLWAASFRLGCAQEVAKRLAEMRHAVLAAATPNALVKVDQRRAEVDGIAATLGLVPGRASRTTLDYGAHAAGKAAGANVSVVARHIGAARMLPAAGGAR